MDLDSLLGLLLPEWLGGEVEEFAGPLRLDELGDFVSPDLYSEFLADYANPEMKGAYKTAISDLTNQYMTKPAGFLGFLEESELMWKDVMAASIETGVDPSFLYNVTMQEGMGERVTDLYEDNVGRAWSLENELPLYKEKGLEDAFLKWTEPVDIYDPDFPMDIYGDIGMEALEGDQDLAVARGYLSEPISSSHLDLYKKVYEHKKSIHPDAKFHYTDRGFRNQRNESGFMGAREAIDQSDAWRGVGAMLRLNEDYMAPTFEEMGINYDELPDPVKNFWSYASYNAGHKDAIGLLKEFGVDPMNNEKFRKILDDPYGWNVDAEGVHTSPDYKYGSSRTKRWMDNVNRVLGATELANMYSPWR